MRPGTRWRRLAAVILITIGIAVAALFLFRLSVAEALLTAFLQSRSIPGGATVAGLGPGQVRFVDVRLEDLSIDAVDVRWRWTPGTGVTVTDVLLVHPDLSIDLTAERRPFDALRTALEAPGEGEPASLPSGLPALTVEDGSGTLSTATGNLSVHFDLETQTDSPGTLVYASRASVTARGARATTDMRLSWSDGAPRDASLSFVMEDGLDGGHLDGRVDAVFEAPDLKIDMTLTGAVSDGLLTRLALLDPPLVGRVEGHLEGGMSWKLSDAAVLPASSPDKAALHFGADARDIGWEGIANDGHIAWSGDLTFDREADLLDIRPAAPLTIGATFPGWPAHWPSLAALVSPTPSESLSASLRTPLLRLHPYARVASMEEAHADIASDRADRLAVQGPMELRLSPAPALTARADVTFALPALLRDMTDITGNGVIDVEGGAGDIAATLVGPAALAATPGRVLLPDALAWIAGDNIAVRLAAAEPAGSPCLVLQQSTGGFSATLDCDLHATSRKLGRTRIQASGKARQGKAGPPELELPVFIVSSAGLKTPNGTVDHLSARGRLRFAGGQLDGNFAVEADSRLLVADDTRVTGVRGAVVGTMSGVPDDLSLKLKPSWLRADAVERSASGEFKVTPLSIDVADAEIRTTDGVPAGQAQLRLAPAAVETASAVVDMGHVDMSLTTDGQTSAADVRIERAEALAHGLGVYDIRAQASGHGSQRLGVDLLQASFRDLTLPQRFPPSKWSGKVSMVAGRLDGRFTGRPEAAQQVVLAVAGDYDIAQDLGHVTFDLGGVTFGPGLQPRALWPGSANLQEVAGKVTLSGSAEFVSSGLVGSSADLVLDLDSFESGDIGVTGLSLPLILSSLWPIESPPDQHFTVRRIGGGTGVSAVDIEYRVTAGPAGTPVIEIAGGSLETLGGRIRIPPGRLDPSEAVQSLVLEADSLDLVSVLSLITREGVAGEGRLSGRFPIRLEGDALVIDGGILKADAPGRLAFSSPAASQTLQSGGDHMTLLLQVLQNFYFETLSLSVDKAAAGDARLRLSLQGHNPDVLEGYPFAINVDLQTDVAPFLSVLRQGNDMVDEVVKRIWRP